MASRASAGVQDYIVSALEGIEMAESVEKPVVDIALDSRLAEEAGYIGDSTAAKPISRKKKTNRKRRHGELTVSIHIY